MGKLDFSPLENALRSLEEALVPPPRNDRERDGAIQRFEYTFELCWKYIRRVLIAMGRSDASASPKPLFRDAHIEGMIGDVTVWFGFLEARNNVAHIYDSREAAKVFTAVQRFLPVAHDLLRELKQRDS